MIYIDAITPAAERYLQNPAVSGLTCNPSIIRRDRPEWGFSQTVAYLNKLAGHHFIQGSVRATDWVGFLADGVKKGNIIPEKFIVKLAWEPATAAPLLPKLHELGFKVCATAVYSVNHYYIARCANADRVAVYVDRMKKAGIDPWTRIGEMVKCRAGFPGAPRLLAASIKTVEDANRLLQLGVQDLTFSVEVADDFFKGDFPADDANRFEADYKL